MYDVSFYDLKLRKKLAMALLSKVTVVVKPSIQPETPAPITGQPLPVFVPQMLDNPSKTGSTKIALVMQYDNPVSGMSNNFSPRQAEEHDTMTPQNIHGVHEVIRDWDWGMSRPIITNSQPYNAFLPANCGEAYNASVYRGNISPSNIELGAAQQPALNQFSSMINGKTSEIQALLTSNLGESLFTPVAYNILSGRLASDRKVLTTERIVHMWVMCGVAYSYTDHGNIYQSDDAFNQQSVLFGTVADNVQRMHCGITENDLIQF